MADQVFIYELPSERLGCMAWSQGRPVAYGSAHDIGSFLKAPELCSLRLKTERVYDRLPERAEKDASVI